MRLEVILALTDIHLTLHELKDVNTNKKCKTSLFGPESRIVKVYEQSKIFSCPRNKLDCLLGSKDALGFVLG